MVNRLDVIVFGATGYTGKHVAAEVIRHAQKRPGFTWGIAGRSEDKLKKVIQGLEKKCEQDLSNVQVIVADIVDEKSLVEMAKQAKLIINAVGPYRFYGEPIVKACIEAGAHQVDISGEPQYMERMQLEYGEKAKEKGVYIVSACGFDSIPADLGVTYVEDKFDGTVNSIETYLENWTDAPLTGAALNTGTWESAVYGLAHADELKSLRSQLYPVRTPKFEPRMERRSVVHKSDVVEGKWCVPFPGSDRSVVMRSQRYFYDNNKKRPVQMEAYMVVGSLFHVIFLGICAGIFAVLAKFKAGRSLLLKYPGLFSLGYFSKDGPKEEELKLMNFSITFYAKGWSADKRLAEPTDQHTEPPNKTLVAKVHGKDPGYGATSMMLVTAGLTILDEKDKLPETGGVLPPGAVFAKTSLIQKLNENGVTFEVLNVKTEDNKED